MHPQPPTPPSEGTILNVSGVSKSYPLKSRQLLKVLDNISLVVGSGSVVSVIGPSGCGKSTLLRILAGLEEPDSGEVIHRGHQSAKDLRIPLVLQSPALLPWKSILHNVAFAVQARSRPEVLSQAREYIRAVGLGGFESFLPRDISGGMRARVSIARSLAASAELVMFDEAFADLDQVTRRTLNSLFCEHVEKRGLSAVVVSHDIGEAVYLADRVVVLTPQPASVASGFDIQLSRPRLPSLWDSPEFLEARRPIEDLVRGLWVDRPARV